VDIIYKNSEAKNSVFIQTFISHAILIACGDYRAVAVVRKCLKRIYGFKEMDILTTAGGSKTITYSLKIKKGHIVSDIVEYLKIFCKRIALWLDFGAYFHHGAKVCVIADHNYCGFWPDYKGDDAREQAEHVRSLIEAGRIVKEKYPDIERIIMFYVVLDKETHRALKILEVDFSGNIKEIVLSEEEKMV